MSGYSWILSGLFPSCEGQPSLAILLQVDTMSTSSAREETVAV